MQDQLKTMVRKNYEEFFDLIISLIPKNVNVKSTQTVENEFEKIDYSASGKEIPKKPLFFIEIT